jgi:putative transposase
VILVHKIALDPTRLQAESLARACGVARFAWNWALAEWQRQYEAGEKPNEAKLRRELNATKAADFPWMLEVPKAAPQQAIKNLGMAFARFFKRQGKYPRFKKKGVARDSFRADNGPGTFMANGRTIRLPRIGTIRMREEVRFPGVMKSAVVSRTAGRWFVAVAVECEIVPAQRETQTTACGVDLGIKTMAVVSDGTRHPAPKALGRRLKRLKRLNRALSRKRKGSANRRKAAARVAKLHARIASVRRDALHKATTAIVRDFAVIGIEDLNVRGMLANRRLARAIGDVGMHEFRRQLTYKATMTGAKIVVVDRWFPSSKTCSCCGVVADAMPLSVRDWTCAACGAEHDRDLNAAINLRTAASSAVAACGEARSGAAARPLVPVRLDEAGRVAA